jgi:ESF2/ABP1 family protein
MSDSKKTKMNAKKEKKQERGSFQKVKSDIVSKEEKSTMLEEAAKYREKLQARGVMYLSRVPPFMKPNKLRELLQPYGEITRLYIQEEDASVRKRRQKNGGNGSKQFVEGWIEYAEKRIAKDVAKTLNGNRIGTKKGDFYYDDLWNLKYLKGFKWEFLTEKIAYERRIRDNKLRNAMVISKQQNAVFVEQVEKQKQHKQAEARREKEGKIKSKEGKEGKRRDIEIDDENKRKRFKQQRVLASQHGERDAKADPMLLSSIFNEK